MDKRPLKQRQIHGHRRLSRSTVFRPLRINIRKCRACKWFKRKTHLKPTIHFKLVSHRSEVMCAGKSNSFWGFFHDKTVSATSLLYCFSPEATAGTGNYFTQQWLRGEVCTHASRAETSQPILTALITSFVPSPNSPSKRLSYIYTHIFLRLSFKSIKSQFLGN